MIPILSKDLTYGMAWANDEFDAERIKLKENIKYGRKPLIIGNPILAPNLTTLME